MTRALKSKKGQALVEFALIISLIVMLGIGAIQMLIFVWQALLTNAAAKDAIEIAAIHGGDTPEFRAQLPAILATYRLPDTTIVTVDPPQANYLQPITVQIDRQVMVKIILFDVFPFPIQEGRALSQKDWNW